MMGKVLNVSSNDLYGNVDDRKVIVYACFEHTKYMNNYVVFSFEGDNKLCYGSIHLKNNSLVIFKIKHVLEKNIKEFLEEYINNNLIEYKLIDIKNIQKIELVSYNEMVYDELKKLYDISIPSDICIEVEEVKEKKSLFLYLLLIIFLFLGSGLTFLYFKPELFMIQYKMLNCSNNFYDDNIELNYKINKLVKFDKDDKIDNISVTRVYAFLDSDSYYEFKDSNVLDKYFNNGEGYKFFDDELKFKLFYEEDSVIDDYDEMLEYLKKEGYSCIESEYEK